MAPDGSARGPVEGPEGAPAPLPAGVRDVLPVECAELRALEARLRDAFARFGYREVRTPLIEFASVLDRAQEGGLGRAFRLFDDHGNVLVLRPDLTIPVARLLATRMADHPGPVRVSYVARAVRPPAPGRAQAAEARQAGVELVGMEGPEADAEVIALLAQALGDAGVEGFRIGVGDVSLIDGVLAACHADDEDRRRLRAALASRNLVAWRRESARLGLPEPLSGLLAGLPGMRGGADVLDALDAAAPEAREATTRLRRVLELVDSHGVGDVVMLDVGVLRDWPYYSGVVLEAYVPGVAEPVAVGGRYDGLAARFGRPRPAVGVAVVLDLLHRALAVAAGTVPAVLVEGVVLVGGSDLHLQLAREVRAAGMTVVALPAGDPSAEDLAAADGWRLVVRPVPGGLDVLDMATGARTRVAGIGEVLSSVR